MNKYGFLLWLITWGCSFPEQSSTDKNQDTQTLFRRLKNQETGIDFENRLLDLPDFDVFRYRNFYNGGGVGIADINNDGLADVYLTSNMGDNKLYLNKGNFKFEDITEKAGVKGTQFWSTGVSMVDVNADGLLDIYVCNSGDIKGDKRENELFINNGNLTFTEKAAEYGLADKGFSTHAVFFDYDKDGDIDCYVLNNSFRPVSTLGFKNLRDTRDDEGGDKLYANQNGHFVDVSEKAGIYGSVIGFGLGITVGDINNDNWPDLYVSNDFYERDYLYINNQDGTFSEQLEQYIGHHSMFSMGSDLADLNNDGKPEIFSTDMLPEDDYRQKTIAAFETYDVHQLRLKSGYYHQYMRNMLQVNVGDKTFIEMGEMAGVSRTDWSWGALMADFDNDAYKEIFISNGIFKDVTNQDFVEFLGSNQVHAALEGKPIDYTQVVKNMNSQKLSNYMLKKSGEWKYENVSPRWGLDEPSFSNGAAYGDLDNDGDLDLIVNNVNQEVFVYNNQTNSQKGNNYLSVQFKGAAGNVFGLGASVYAFVGNEQLFFDHMPIRGFQSSMDYKMVIGLGKHKQIDSLKVVWPDDKMQVLRNVKANQILVADYTLANTKWTTKKRITKTLLQEVKSTEVVHQQSNFNDFDRDRLLYYMLSTEGPAFVKADINKDGMDDFFVGGSAGKPSAIYLQKSATLFTKLNTTLFDVDSLSDDVAALFFDADGDKDDDLYVVTGGSEYTSQSENNLDRLYINQGMRNGYPSFEKSEGKIPKLYQSGSCVKAADIDNDGDLDLFVGTRVLPSYYGLPCDQFILINDGLGNFSDATSTIAPQFKKLGMVTDAVWFDYDHNDFVDLMMVGDWMPITIFSNDGKQFTKVNGVQGLEKSEGWWNTVEAADLDNDGDMDFVLGNLGLNSKFKPSSEKPISLYINDFDQNGSIEPIYSFVGNDGKEYPMALRQDMVKQMISMKKQFVFYRDYASKSMTEMFDSKLLKQATVLKFYEPNSAVLINNGKGDFQCKALPILAQVSPVFGIKILDITNDKIMDIIIGGNRYAVKPEVGRYDALLGLVLKGDQQGGFTPLNFEESGLRLKGEVRHIEVLNSKEKKMLAFVRFNDTIKFYSIK